VKTLMTILSEHRSHDMFGVQPESAPPEPLKGAAALRTAARDEVLIERGVASWTFEADSEVAAYARDMLADSMMVA